MDTLPISPNPGQENMDKLSNTINDRVKTSMGRLQDTGPEGRTFLDGEHSLFGYNGVVVRDGDIVSLVNTKQDSDIPPINLGDEIIIEGNSMGYVTSGHNPGDKVKVVGFIEPFYETLNGEKSSDKIIKVEGVGLIGWIKPSELNRDELRRFRDEEISKLFDVKQ